MLTSRRAPPHFKCVVEVREHRAGIVEEGAPGLGQFNTARLAAESLNIKFAFDRLDPLTEWWLLHAKPLRGPRDVTFLSNRDEIPEVPQFHFHIRRRDMKIQLPIL